MASAQVFDHVIGLQDVGTDLIAPAGFHVFAFESSPLCLLFLQLQVVETPTQDFHGHLAVPGLGTLILTGDHDSCGQVGDAHGGGVFLHVLAAGARRAVDLDLEVVRINVHFDVFGDIGPYLHQGEGGVAAAGEVEGGDAHQTMNPAFRFEVAVGIRPGHLDGDGF